MVGAEKLGIIFQSEMDADLMADIVTTLYTTYYNNENDDEKGSLDIDFILSILDSISKVKRFSLSIAFLSTKQTSMVQNLFVQLEHDVKEMSSTTTLMKLKAAFMGK